jgi:hypothetical protein
MFASSDASFASFVDTLENTFLIETDRDQYTYDMNSLADKGET